MARAHDRLRAVAVRPHRGRRLRPERAARRPHAHARRRLPRRAHGRRDRAHRRHLPDAGGAAVLQPQTLDADALAAATKHNRSVLASSRVASWLPSYRIKRAGRAPRRRARSCSAATSAARRLLGARDADRAHGRPRQGPRPGRLDRGHDRRPDRLRLAGEPLRRDRALGRPAGRRADRGAGSGVSTAIHKFDISSPTKTVYLGSGNVPGYLLSQWSLSEFGGVLRVVSTDTPAWWGEGGETESYLTTLREAGRRPRPGRPHRRARQGRARLRGALRRQHRLRRHLPPDRPALHGRPHRPGAPARARRAEDPRLLGLPAPDRRGPDARHRPGRRRERAPLGTQISIFDVSDLRNPSCSTAHARPGLVRGRVRPPRVPLLAEDGARRRPVRADAAGFRVSRAAGSTARPHRERRGSWTPPIRRSLVVGGSVLTVSDAGVGRAASPRSRHGWAAFPQRSRRLGAAPIGARRKENHA